MNKLNKVALALFMEAATRYQVSIERLLLDLVLAQKGWRGPQ
jgi:hypothetical protein